MSAVDWLTPADLAELDVLVWHLAADYQEHRRHCRSCAASRQPGGLPCPHLQTAVRVVVDWRSARQLLSRAQALRADTVGPPGGGGLT